MTSLPFLLPWEQDTQGNGCEREKVEQQQHVYLHFQHLWQSLIWAGIENQKRNRVRKVRCAKLSHSWLCKGAFPIRASAGSRKGSQLVMFLIFVSETFVSLNKMWLFLCLRWWSLLCSCNWSKQISIHQSVGFTLLWRQVFIRQVLCLIKVFETNLEMFSKIS